MTTQEEPEPRVSTVLVTPTLAAKWLSGYNNHNRSLRDHLVNSYAADMKAGRWRRNGESIKRAFDGTVIDGQHRLAAIVRSGVGVETLVIEDLPLSAQETVDTGAKRTFGDALTLRGETHATVLSAVTRRVWFWENGFQSNTKGNKVTPTFAQLFATLEAHPDLREAARIGSKGKHYAPVSGSIIAFCYWLFSRIDKTDAEFFINKLCEGSNLETDDPIYLLRRSLADERRSKRFLFNESYVVPLTIKAWNMFRDGRRGSLLRYRPGGAKPEPFPEPH